MMKKIVYFSVLFLLINSCSVKEQPVFVKIDNVKVISFKMDTIRLKANAFFKNPNDVGGKISTDEIKIFVNGEELAQVSSEEFKVPARSDFTVPLIAAIPTKKILESNKNGILGGLLNSLTKRSVNVQLKGDLKYKVLGFSSTYSVDKTQEVKF